MNYIGRVRRGHRRRHAVAKIAVTWIPIALSVACGRSGFDPDADGGDVADGGVTIPDAGPRANVAFVTSSVHRGDFGGVAGADAICADRAADAGLPGTFLAWLSTGGIPAHARLDGSRGWRRTDGAALVPSGPSDLITGRIIVPLAMDELGRDARVGLAGAWTGTAWNGNQEADCDGWSNAVANGRDGAPARGGGGFTDTFGNANCGQLRRLYCFEIGQDVLVAPTITPGRLAFTSAAIWSPGAGGLASADAVCQAEAIGAGHAGTFLAALPTSTTATQARFDLGGAPWVRADGVRVTPTATGLFNAEFLDAHLGLTAAGNPVVSNTTFSPAPNLVGDHCSDWTASVGLTRVGDSESTARGEVFNFVDHPCSAAAHVICLQT